MEKRETGRKEAIGGKVGHGSKQRAQTQQRKVASTSKSAQLHPVYTTEELQASHTSLAVTDDSTRKQGCFSMLLLLTAEFNLLLALLFLGEWQGRGRGLGLQGILPGR